MAAYLTLYSIYYAVSKCMLCKHSKSKINYNKTVKTQPTIFRRFKMFRYANGDW